MNKYVLLLAFAVTLGSGCVSNRFGYASAINYAKLTGAKRTHGFGKWTTTSVVALNGKKATGALFRRPHQRTFSIVPGRHLITVRYTFKRAANAPSYSATATVSAGFEADKTYVVDGEVLIGGESMKLWIEDAATGARSSTAVLAEIQR